MDVATAKQQLLDLCEQGAPDGDGERYAARVKALIDALVVHNPSPTPLTDRAFDGRWSEAYSSLGVRYARGRPLRGQFSLQKLSFGKLPDIPVQLESVHQEVDRDAAAYNNVIDFSANDGDSVGRLIMFGRFTAHEENPLRAVVDFNRVALRPLRPESESEWRTALGLSGDLEHEFKPPKLSSDVVYLDDEVRINFGSVGGVYVLRQTGDPSVSLD